jgi:hypothetical protein
VKKTRPLLAVIAVALGPALGLLASCVIVDPPAQLPSLPRRRPVIVSTDPPQGRVLTEFPATFLVNVETSDPQQDIAWEVWFDYDPNYSGSADPAAANDELPAGDAGIQTISIESLQAPVGLERCHTIEILVSPGLFNPPHVPARPGGDSAFWIYDPSGGACPSYDAGQFADGYIAPTDAGGP